MDVPLTPIVVDVVTFDRAPLGRRGYNEDQVDDFLDRVQATLAGEDHLTAHEVRGVEFDPAPFIKRGYHEDQVDEFLDLVVEELDRRAGVVPGTGMAAYSGRVTSFAAPGAGGAHTGVSPGSGGAHASGFVVIGGSGSHGLGATPAGGTHSGAHGSSGTPAGGFPTQGGTPGSGTHSPSTAPSGSTPSGARGPSSGGTPESGTSGSSGTPASGFPNPSGTPTGGAPSSGTHSPDGVPAGGTPAGGSAGAPYHPGQVPGSSGMHASDTPASVWMPSSGQPGLGGTPVAWVPFPQSTPREVPPPTAAEQTNPMLFAQPPSLPSPSTQPLKREGAASGPPNSSVAAPTDKTGAAKDAPPPSVAAGQAASAFRAGALPELVEDDGDTPAEPARTLADYAPKAPEPEPEPAAPDAEEPALPFPPAPSGEPGYAPSDVARLMKLLTASPDREQLTNLTFAVITSGGYHTATVDAFRQAWIDALPTKQP